MTSYNATGIRDAIAALQQIVREHGPDLTLDAFSDVDGEEGGSIVAVDRSGGHVAQVYLGSRETDTRLLKFIQPITPHARRKAR